jgi:hypothetical protein
MGAGLKDPKRQLSTRPGWNTLGTQRTTTFGVEIGKRYIIFVCKAFLFEDCEMTFCPDKYQGQYFFMTEDMVSFKECSSMPLSSHF